MSKQNLVILIEVKLTLSFIHGTSKLWNIFTGVRILGIKFFMTSFEKKICKDIQEKISEILNTLQSIYVI